MRSSIKLFSIRGIDVRLHATFPLILIWAAFQFGYLTGGGAVGALFGVIIVSLLFVLVTLHELGHSFAARFFGVPVEQIVLLPIGGVAQLARMPRKPFQEFIIALAGPLVNVAVGILMLLLAPFLGFSFTNPLLLLNSAPTITLTTIFAYLFYYNIALAVFNMIPAFPMDGGRVLRSLLAMWMNYGRATRIATSVGRALAIGLGIYGLFNGAISLLLIAFFVYGGATQEYRVVNHIERMRGLKVSHAYTKHPLTLSPYDNLQRAINFRQTGMQQAFPVVYAGKLIGFVRESDLQRALAERPLWTPIKDIMSQNVNPVSESSGLEEVEERMQAEQISALPVVDGEQFMGIITRRQIAEIIHTLRVRPDLIKLRSAQA